MHSVTLLLLVLYATPFAVIIWHTLNERLPVYHRTYFPEYKEFQFDPTLSSFIDNLFGYMTSHESHNMSTRYWDEIDWYIQEGTRKLMEMAENEAADASSSKWSSGEGDGDLSAEEVIEASGDEVSPEKTEDVTDRLKDLQLKDSAWDGDSEKEDEDYMQRSTSVEDKGSSTLKEQSKVDELHSLCAKCGLMPPVYTYFTVDDEKVVSTVQLWNGVRFSSHPQRTRNEAMEKAAKQTIDYLKGELRENRPVSTSPPASVPYYATVPNVSPYYASHRVYASPVTYPTIPSQQYHLTSGTYTVLPTVRTLVTAASDYQHPSYRIGPHYGQFLHYYPYIPVQVSPSHQPKRPNVYQSAGPQPVMWNFYPKEAFLINDKANTARTEYKILDEPPVLEKNENQETKKPEMIDSTQYDTENEASRASEDVTAKDTSSVSSATQKKTKAKLAICFKPVKKHSR